MGHEQVVEGRWILGHGVIVMPPLGCQDGCHVLSLLFSIGQSCIVLYTMALYTVSRCNACICQVPL